jgi:hypothetical protein
MDDLNQLGGMTPTHMVLITELVAVCLSARPQPVTFGDEIASHSVTTASPISGAERTKLWRQRKKEASNECDERDVTCDENAVDNNIYNSFSGRGVVGGKPRKSIASHGKRLPDDWNPLDALWSWGKEKLSEPDLRFETAAFKDYWASQPGTRGKKLDWDKTWKTWVREAKRRRERFKSKDTVVQFKPAGPKRTWAEIKADKQRETTDSGC